MGQEVEGADVAGRVRADRAGHHRRGQTHPAHQPPGRLRRRRLRDRPGHRGRGHRRRTPSGRRHRRVRLGREPEAACSAPGARLERHKPRVLRHRGEATLRRGPQPHARAAGRPAARLRRGGTGLRRGGGPQRGGPLPAVHLSRGLRAATCSGSSIRYGAGTTEFKGDTGQFELFDGSPILQLDRKRCIQCHTCVRVCDELEQLQRLRDGRRRLPAR